MKTEQEFRAALAKGFKNLRKQGYVGRQSWQCCMTCGCAALPEGTTKYAFYHRQNTSDLKWAIGGYFHRSSTLKTVKREDVGVYLSWGGDGAVISKAFADAGLVVDWDGSESTKVWVGLGPEPIAPIDHDAEYRTAFEQFVCH